MKQKSVTAGVITFIAYPSFLVCAFVVNLFSNRSFSLFGFGLDMSIMKNSAEIGLFMKPYFFLSFIFIYAISLGLMMLYDLLKKRKGDWMIQALSYELKQLDAWYTITIAVLLVLGAILYFAMLIWCIRNGKGTFTGSYSWKSLISVRFSCTW